MCMFFSCSSGSFSNSHYTHIVCCVMSPSILDIYTFIHLMFENICFQMKRVMLAFFNVKSSFYKQQYRNKFETCKISGRTEVFTANLNIH